MSSMNKNVDRNSDILKKRGKVTWLGLAVMAAVRRRKQEDQDSTTNLGYMAKTKNFGGHIIQGVPWYSQWTNSRTVRKPNSASVQLLYKCVLM